jgi:hypothetical protein
MAQMPDNRLTRIPSSQMPILEADTVLISREWFRFLNAMFEQLGGGAGGASGSFTTVDGKTVTVVNGIITEIV